MDDELTKREFFVAQALANPAICTGHAEEYDLKRWFGDRGGITRGQIAAKQAVDYANYVLSELTI